MEDVLTEIPPPSRFFQEDLNNFIPPSPSLPSPFLAFSHPKPSTPLRPSLLIIALSSPSLYVFHHLPSKTSIGSLILPETLLSGMSIEPSIADKSCNIYALNGADSVLLVSVQCNVTPERAHTVARVLIGEDIVPDKVLILDSVQSRNFRGKLSADETLAFKLETSAEKRASTGSSGGSPLLKGLDYFPSGSMIDGFPAALLSRCQIKNVKGTLCVSWPHIGASAVALIKSVLKTNVLPNVDFGAMVEGEHGYAKFKRIQEQPIDSDIYT